MNKSSYDILEISSDASKEEITKAYRKLASKYHPDVCKDPDAIDKFKKINEAYEDLTTEKKSSFNDDFFYRPFEDDYRLLNISMDINIPIEYLIFGKEMTLNSSVYDICDICKGSGVSEYKKCTKCNGSKFEILINGGWEFRIPCTFCKGKGRVGITKCQCNHGFKEIEKRDFELKIEPGLPNGNIIRIPMNKVTILNCKIHVDNHPNIHVVYGDIIYRIYIPGSVAYHGGKIDLKFFEKTFNISIPQLTQSGTKFRLKGQGISNGDMHVVTEIDVNSLNTEKPQEKIILDFSNK